MVMSWIWKASSTRPCPDRLASASSATWPAKAARSRMTSSTDIRPTIARSAPDNTSWVKPTMPSCCIRNRCAAARIASSVPPTLTIATPSRLAFTPRSVTAPRTATGMCREERSSVNRCCTNGTTNTPPPTTTFWPLLSVNTRPVSGSVDLLPRRPVTMNASLGPATL